MTLLTVYSSVAKLHCRIQRNAGRLTTRYAGGTETRRRDLVPATRIAVRASGVLDSSFGIFLSECEIKAVFFDDLLEELTMGAILKLSSICARWFAFAKSASNGPAESSCVLAAINTVILIRCARGAESIHCDSLAAKLSAALLDFPTITLLHACLREFCYLTISIRWTTVAY